MVNIQTMPSKSMSKTNSIFCVEADANKKLSKEQEYKTRNTNMKFKEEKEEDKHNYKDNSIFRKGLIYKYQIMKEIKKNLLEGHFLKKILELEKRQKLIVNLLLSNILEMLNKWREFKF